jgi:hypothetical protein
VRAPVGIEIGAETPAEIAVSVAAELIMLRRGVLEAAPIADRERVLERLLPEVGAQETGRAPETAAAPSTRARNSDYDQSQTREVADG